MKVKKIKILFGALVVLGVASSLCVSCDRLRGKAQNEDSQPGQIQNEQDAPDDADADEAVEISAEEDKIEQALAWEEQRITDRMVCRFILDRRDDFAVVPTIGDFGLLAGTDWTYPVKRPQKHLLMIKMEIEEKYNETEQTYREGLQKEMQEKITAEVTQENPMHKVGDRVSIVLRNGIGTATKVEGRIRNMGMDKVQIGERWISRVDFSDADVLLFFQAEHDEYVAQEARRRLVLMRTQALDKLDKEKREELREAWLADEYIPDVGTKIYPFPVDEKCWMSKIVFLRKVRKFLNSQEGRQYLKEMDAEEDADEDEEKEKEL